MDSDMEEKVYKTMGRSGALSIAVGVVSIVTGLAGGVTKEIGEHVSLSFFANNFTNSRPYVKSLATGVGAIFTPAFYYGLTCRLKF